MKKTYDSFIHSFIILYNNQRTEKTMDHEGGGDISCSWCTWNSSGKVRKKIGRIVNQRKNQDHPDHRIVKIGCNTQKSSGVLRRFIVIKPLKATLTTIGIIIILVSLSFFRSLARSSLFVWVLWHVNLCTLYNAKSIFMQINTSISKNSV